MFESIEKKKITTQTRNSERENVGKPMKETSFLSPIKHTNQMSEIELCTNPFRATTVSNTTKQHRKTFYGHMSCYVELK